MYGKCSKISNTFLFLFLNKMLVLRAGIHKNCLSEWQTGKTVIAVCTVCLSLFGRQLVFKILNHLPYNFIQKATFKFCMIICPIKTGN